MSSAAPPAMISAAIASATMSDVMTHRLVRTLEELAYRAWPAAEVHDVDGWRARFTHGVTRRGNSAWALGCRGEMASDERLAAIERFYHDRGLPARIQLSPACAPPDLDRLLAARGWQVEAPVAIRTAAVADVAALSGDRNALTAHVFAEPVAEWFGISAVRGRFAGVQDIYRGLLGRIADDAGYALVHCDGQPAGVGMGVVAGSWAGVFSMFTIPEARRRGVGRAVVHALADWAAGRGARRLYLQVERTSRAATSFYRVIGFREVYGYHYRTLPLPATDG